jgi:hypothetical protein
MKRMLLFVVLASLVAAASAVAAPGLKLDKQDLASKVCKPADSKAKQLVDVHYKLINDYDSGFAGNAWANDTIDRHLRLYGLAHGTFCANVEDHGTFLTFAGTSPSGASTVAADVKGSIDGGYNTTFFTGTFDNPSSLPTHGNLGTFDLACINAYTCPGDHPSYLSYFSSTSGADLAQWGWIYKAGKHGTWLNQDDVAAADSGDIN